MGGYIIALEQAEPAFLQRVRPRGFERALWEDDIDNAKAFHDREHASRWWERQLRDDASGHRIAVITIDEARVWSQNQEPPAPVYLRLLSERMLSMVGADHYDCARLARISQQFERLTDQPGWNGKT